MTYSWNIPKKVAGWGSSSMNMVCPRCGGGFEQRLVCPKCKVRLVLQSLARGATVPLPRLMAIPAGTPWSRVLISLQLAYGTYFGLKQLCMAGLLVSEGEPGSEIWTGNAGPALVLALQSIGVLVGGILVAAGQRRGPAHGFIVGTLTGLLFVSAFPSQIPSLGRFSLVIDPASLALVGFVSGWIGRRIWKPLEDIAFGLGDQAEAFGLKRRRGVNPFAGPISGFRVAVGVAVCIPASCWGFKLVLWATEFSQGMLAIELQQMRLFSWMLSAIGLLFGSIIAGSAVRNSLKQGLCVGLMTMLIVVGHRFYIRGLPTLSWTLLTCGMTMGACLLGSWFGGQLLPPLAPRKKIQIWPLV
jgi:hypothetical protein